MIYVLGLDVSMNSTGWAVLSVSEGVVQYVDSGIIKANTNHSHGQRLRKQRDKFEKIIREYPISHVAREAGFSHHIKSTQVLFKAYGVAEEFFAEHALVEYAAATIKKYVAGNGRASKEQVEDAIRNKLKLSNSHVFASDDETDAIAVALTHIEKLGLAGKQKPKRGKRRMKKVVFDYGHGGSDSGAIGYGLYEKNVVLELGRMTKAEIEKRYEVEVIETRSGDQTRSLTYRSDFANNRNVDFFVSFHNNAFNGKAEGFETFIYDKLSDSSSTNQMRNEIHAEIMAFLKKYGISDRGRKKENFHVLRETNMPAILIEFLFIDNAAENKLLKDDNFLRGLAAATAVGIAKAMNLKAKPQPKPTPKPSQPSGTIYRVQVGAFKNKANAEELEKKVQAKGFDAFVKLVDGLYKVQVGAYSVKANAEAQEERLQKARFDAFITTK